MNCPINSSSSGICPAPEIRTGVHWTMGHFGNKLNVIPDHAEAFADIRVTRTDEFDRIRTTIEERINNKLIPDCHVDFNMDISSSPLPERAGLLWPWLKSQ